MHFSEHCKLCKHEKADLNKGILCGLTNKKPSFYKTCTSLIFDQKLVQKLFEVTEELQNLKEKKLNIYGNFVFYNCIGILLITSGIIFRQYLIQMEYNWTDEYYYFPFIPISFGCSSIGLGLTKLINYYKNLKYLKEHKQYLDKFLRLYNKTNI